MTSTSGRGRAADLRRSQARIRLLIAVRRAERQTVVESSVVPSGLVANVILYGADADDRAKAMDQITVPQEVAQPTDP